MKLDESIYTSDTINKVNDLQGNRLLSQCYPEGSPRHPSYPAGHAVNAGACATILKALFDEKCTYC